MKGKENEDVANFNKNLFGSTFEWGVSTSAYQIEGAFDADGKGHSIWDVFTEQKNKVHNNDHAKTSSDFYNNYEADIKLLAELNIPNFRMSIAWTRILPQGIGAINKNGIEFYNKVFDCCKKYNIEPWVTLYHWDLPQALQDKGGWCNREIVNWFLEFVNVCILYFGNKIKYWMVLNEPMVYTGAGYFLGVHAPGKKGLKYFLPAVHHTVICQAQGIKLLKQKLPNAIVGTTFSCSYIEPHSNSKKDIQAAHRIDALINRLFLEPLLGLGYPSISKVLDKKLLKYFLPNDEQLLHAEADFIGLQNYTKEVVKHSLFIPYLSAKIIEAKNRNVAITEMNWEIHPESIYEMLKKFDAYPNIKKIIVTENGAAFADEIKNNSIDDKHRIDFLKQYLQQVLRAKNEGVKVDGYFIWSFIDNFEWAEGYKPRFGLININFETLERLPKKSAEWFQDFLK
jgi:beta-glucosidase